MSINKLLNGHWRADIEPVKGKRFRKTFKTKAEALRFEAYIRSNVVSAAWQPEKQDKRKLSELIAIWYDLHGRNLRDSERRLARLNAMCQAMKNPIAEKMTATMFANFRAARLDSGISQRTVNNDLCFMNALYNELYRLQVITYQNPLALVKSIRTQEKSLSFLTKEQIKELLLLCETSCNPHVRLLTLICLSTGCRWSEAENIKPQNLKSNIITFERTKSARVRSVPVSDCLTSEILKHWKKYGLFSSSMSSFRRVLAKCSFNLPTGQATHILRHTFASHFVQNGGNILVLQKILGHSTIAMTMRYSHLAPDHLQEALQLNPLVGFDTLSTLKR